MKRIRDAKPHYTERLRRRRLWPLAPLLVVSFQLLARFRSERLDLVVEETEEEEQVVVLSIVTNI